MKSIDITPDDHLLLIPTGCTVVRVKGIGLAVDIHWLVYVLCGMVGVLWGMLISGLIFGGW